MDSANIGNADSAVQKLLSELKKVRSDLVDQLLAKIEEENLTPYAKMARLEYLVQQFLRSGAPAASGEPSVGPSLVADKKTVAYSIKKIVFPEPQWSGNALPRVPLRKFYKDLRKITQEAILQGGLINPPVGTDGAKILTEVQEAQRKEILQLLGYCGEDHYSLISLGGMLYGFLDSLYASYGAKKLLTYTFELRILLSQYNAHDPHTNVMTERAGLYEMRRLPAICLEAANYLDGAEFASLVSAANDKGKAKATVSKDNLASWAGVPNFAITAAAEASTMKVTAGNDGIPTKAVLLVKAEEVVVNLDRSRPLPVVVKEIGVNASRVIDDATGQTMRLLNLAQAADYNLATGEWGSYVMLSDNERKMREIEPLIFQKALGAAITDEMLPPVFWLVTEYTTFLLPTRTAYGELLYSESVKPGQTTKLRITTGTTSKQATAQSQTIFEELSDEATREFQDEFNKTVAERNALTTDAQDYLALSMAISRKNYWDFNAKFDTTFKIGGGDSGGSGGSGGTGLGGIGTGTGGGGAPSTPMGGDLTLGLGYNTGEEQQADIGIDEELTKQVTTEQETSNEVQSKALQRHVAKQSAKKSTNVTVSTDTSTEITRQESRSEEFTNPSTVAGIDIEVHKVYQEYVAIRAITNFHVAFMNGVDYTMKDITGLDEMLGEYLDLSREDTLKGVGRFKHLITIAGHRVDYMGRAVEALVEKNGQFQFRKGPYHKLLPTGLTEDDIDIEPVKDRVYGIVIDVTPYRIPTAGTKTLYFMGGIALDPNAKDSFREALQRQKLENAQTAAGVEWSQVENSRAKLDEEIVRGFFTHLSKAEKIGEVEKFWQESVFKILKDIRELFDKRKFTDLEHGARRGSGDDDDDGSPFEGAPPRK